MGKSPDTVKLDEADLDEEDLKLLAEVKKKGYYHGRPPSSNDYTPQRIDAGAVSSSAGPQRIDPATASGSRTEFDAFQKKWDKFDSDKFLKECGVEVKETSKSRINSGKKSKEETSELAELLKWFDPLLTAA